MFGTVLISLCTIIHIYIFWRASSVPFLKKHIPLITLISAGLILWLIFYMGRVYGHNGTGFIARALEIAGMHWMGILFLTFVPLIATDLFSGFGFFLPGIAPSLRGWAMIAGCLLSLIALFQGLRPPVVDGFEVRIKGLPEKLDGTVIVAVSDLHIGSMIGRGWLEKRIEQVQKLEPDLFVLLGDIFEGHGKPEQGLVEILQRVKAPLGLWAVTGNHEFHGDIEENMSIIKNAGFGILRDRWVQIARGLILAGVDDLTSRRRAGFKGDPVSSSLKDRPPGATVLLSHTPWEADRAAACGVNLMLSGHTHGGQIWPMGYLTRLSYPLMSGRYLIEGMTVIVCRGTGTWGPRMRLWKPGEILKITLLRGDSQKEGP